MCSYGGGQSIDMIGRFMAEHDEIVNATGELRRAVLGEEPDAVAPARAEVARLLWPHTEAEEVGLFRVMAREEEFTDHIATLCGEHRTLDDYLSEVEFGATAAMALFEDALREHINKEDNGLFPAAAIALSGPDWDEVDATTPPAGAASGSPASHHHDHEHDHEHDHPGHDHDHDRHDHASVGQQRVHGDRAADPALEHEDEQSAAW